MGSICAGVAVWFKNSAKVLHSELNARPKNTPSMIATGFANLVKVSVVGMTIASCPNCSNGVLVDPGGGVTSRKSVHNTIAVTLPNASNTRDWVRRRYQYTASKPRLPHPTRSTQKEMDCKATIRTKINIARRRTRDLVLRKSGAGRCRGGRIAHHTITTPP